MDEEALIAALKSGKVAGAGLDVYLQEPGGNPDISSLNNVFMLPPKVQATTMRNGKHRQAPRSIICTGFS